MNRKNNARFRETETRVEAAALELMREKSKVNVRTVCERAQLNRSTFYAHFQDVPDMISKMESALHRQLLDAYPANNTEPLTEESFVPILEHVREHAYFYGIALEQRSRFPLSEGFDGLIEKIARPRCQRAGIVDFEEMVRMLVFFQAGFTMALRRWVEGGCAEDERVVAHTLAECVPVAWV